MQEMEALTAILRSMRVKCSVYFCETVVAPWSMEFSNTHAASFHLLRRGSAWVVSGEQQQRLSAGDLVFMEPGRTHVLSSDLPGDESDSDGAESLLLCGYWEYQHEISTPLMDVFPSMTIVREEELLRHPWLRSTLDQLSAEYLSGLPGSELVVNRLTEVVLIELIRINFGRSEKSHFVSALFDKPVSGALQRLHKQPEKAWTLELMAEQVNLSRASFAKRFKDLVRQPMFVYLTNLRVQRAKELLATTSLPLYEVADRVGYSSDLAFTKTFKKHTGVTPIGYRKSKM